MSKYNLYPSISDRNQKGKTRTIMNILSFCDNNHLVEDISKITRINKKIVEKYLKKLKNKKIIYF